MTDNAVLTSDDIEELASGARASADPLAVAAQLREAADRGRVADPEDVGYAFLLAAEMYDEADQSETALELVERAIAAQQALPGGDDGFPRAYRAELLFRAGREEEASAAMAQLRPLLTSDPLAASYVIDALEDCGQEETAVEWLTAALDELTRQQPKPLPPERMAIVEQLALARHRLREDIGLPHDDYDELADTFLPARDFDEDDFDEDDLDEEDLDDPFGGLDDLDDEDGEPVLIWWPRQQFGAVATRWPEVAHADGPGDWDQQRQRRQELLVEWGERGLPQLEQVTGSVDEFATFLAAHDMAGDVEGLEAYTLYLAERGDGVPVPPGRNDACWCGSGGKYKKCCLPLARS